MSDRPVVLVGIGASAGGLEALERLFAALPAPDESQRSKSFRIARLSSIQSRCDCPAIPGTNLLIHLLKVLHIC